MALASAVLLASTLAACGGGDGGGEDSAYCKDLKKASKTFGDLNSGDDLGALDEAFKTFHKLADEAPSDIDEDWKKLDGAITTVEKALKDAGLTFADLAKIQQGQTPEGVDTSKLQGLASEMSKLSSENFTKASKAIETHAKKTCKVDLNAS
jgi:cytochrome c556